MPEASRFEPVLWKGLVAGLAAGLVASFAMDRLQAGLSRLSSSQQDGEPATVKAADKLAVAVTGDPVPGERKPAAGQVVHYLLGAGLGLAYGAVAEFTPAVTAGAGSVFGLGTAVLLDETAVPAAGLGDFPWNTPASTHAYTIVSHLVFGTTAELTRRVTRRLLG